MAADVPCRRRGVVPPYLLERLGRVAPEPVRSCARLTQDVIDRLRVQRIQGVAAGLRRTAAAAASTAVQRHICGARNGTGLPGGALPRSEEHAHAE